MALDPFTAGEQLAGDVLDVAKQVLPNKQQEATNQLTEDKMHTDIIATEASNSSLFVSGWYPCLGYACVFAFSISVLAYAGQFVLWFQNKIIPANMPPTIGPDEILGVLYALIGYHGIKAGTEITKHYITTKFDKNK